MVWYSRRRTTPFFSFPDTVDLPAAFAKAADWIEENPDQLILVGFAATRNYLPCEPAKPAAHFFSAIGRVFHEANVDIHTGSSLMEAVYGETLSGFLLLASEMGTREEVACALRTMEPREGVDPVIHRDRFHPSERYTL